MYLAVTDIYLKRQNCDFPPNALIKNYICHTLGSNVIGQKLDSKLDQQKLRFVSRVVDTLVASANGRGLKSTNHTGFL